MKGTTSLLKDYLMKAWGKHHFIKYCAHCYGQGWQ